MLTKKKEKERRKERTTERQKDRERKKMTPNKIDLPARGLWKVKETRDWRKVKMRSPDLAYCDLRPTSVK